MLSLRWLSCSWRAIALAAYQRRQYTNKTRGKGSRRAAYIDLPLQLFCLAGVQLEGRVGLFAYVFWTSIGLIEAPFQTLCEE